MHCDMLNIKKQTLHMKKSETIALYREEFLKGKDEIDRRQFNEKSEERQYSSIMAWKRRREIAASKSEKGLPQIVNAIKDALKILPELPELPAKEAEKLLSLVRNLENDIENFEAIKKGQLLKKLKSQRISLDREIEILESQGVKEC